MSDAALGYLAAAGAIACFGSMGLFLKGPRTARSKASPIVFGAYHSLSIFATSWLVLAWEDFVFTPYGIAASCLWVPAMLCALFSLKFLPISAAQPLWGGGSSSSSRISNVRAMSDTHVRAPVYVVCSLARSSGLVYLGGWHLPIRDAIARTCYSRCSHHDAWPGAPGDKPKSGSNCFALVAWLPTDGGRVERRRCRGRHQHHRCSNYRGEDRHKHERRSTCSARRASTEQVGKECFRETREQVLGQDVVQGTCRGLVGVGVVASRRCRGEEYGELERALCACCGQFSQGNKARIHEAREQVIDQKGIRQVCQGARQRFVVASQRAAWRKAHL